MLGALEAYLPTELDGRRTIEPAPGLAEGTVVGGKYRIERRIGEGGMGIVVAARHLELGKTVALKLLRNDVGTDVTRFLREAHAAARLGQKTHELQGPEIALGLWGARTMARLTSSWST